MKELLQVHFPGGKRADAHMGETRIPTDQPVDEGGDGSAPEPFSLFLASIAACAGVYAVDFCHARDLSTEGMSLSMSGVFDEDQKRYTKFALHLTLPEAFPEKYRKTVVRVMDLCFVKKHIVDPPAFEITAG